MVGGLTRVVSGVISLYGFDAQGTATFAGFDANTFGISFLDEVTIEHPPERHGKITVDNCTNELKEFIHERWIVASVDQGYLRRYWGKMEGWENSCLVS